MRSQFWDLDFTQGASHDSRPEIFLAHDFQDMDGESGDFTVAEGHGYSLVSIDIRCHFNTLIKFLGVYL